MKFKLYADTDDNNLDANDLDSFIYLTNNFDLSSVFNSTVCTSSNVTPVQIPRSGKSDSDVE